MINVNSLVEIYPRLVYLSMGWEEIDNELGTECIENYVCVIQEFGSCPVGPL